MKYSVNIKKILEKNIEVEASSRLEAQAKAYHKFVDSLKESQKNIKKNSIEEYFDMQVQD